MASRGNATTPRAGMISKLLAGSALSVGMLMAGIPAYAEAANAPAEAAQATNVFDFNIPAQNLNEALLSFARETGIQVFYDTDQVANLTSMAVSGKMTAKDALSKLLDGTGVKFNFSSANSVSLVLASSDDTLTPIVVEAQKANPGDALATEGSGSLTSNMATVGGQTPEAIREIPQAVSVVTRERIEDQNFQYLDDAMRYTTGIQVLQNNNGRSSLYSRGLELNSIQSNGLSVPYASIDGNSPNLAMYDRIEVLRGPSGLLDTASSASINLVRKQAEDTFTGSGTLGYGSWNHYSASGDVSVPLVEDGSVRARFVVSGDDRDSYVDEVSNQDLLGYGTIDADVNDNTFVSVGFSHEDKDFLPNSGLSSDVNGNLLDVDVSTFSGADWNHFEARSDDFYFDLKHKFTPKTDAKLSVRFSNRADNMKYAYTASSQQANGTFRYVGLKRETDEDVFVADTSVNHHFDFLGYDQVATFGASVNSTDKDTKQGTSILGFYSAFSHSSIPETDWAYSDDTTTESDLYATYGKVKLQVLDPVTLSLGSRVNWYHSTVIDNTGADADQKISEDAKVTPFAGVVVDLSQDFSAYASYTSIYEPQTSSLTSAGAQVSPREGEQYEVGIKGEHFGGRLNTSLSVYQLEDKNRAVTDLDAPAYVIASGKIRNRGVEAEVSGEILPNWQGFLSYTFMTTKDLETADAGVPIIYAPKHYVTAWTDYSFDGGQLDGLNLGGGFTWSDTYTYDNGRASMTAPAYKVVDARIGYDINDNLEVALNANNIFDEKYYSRVGSAATFNYYGPSRNFMLTFKGKF